jgi:hypothetical protein
LAGRSLDQVGADRFQPFFQAFLFAGVPLRVPVTTTGSRTLNSSVRNNWAV